MRWGGSDAYFLPGLCRHTQTRASAVCDLSDLRRQSTSRSSQNTYQHYKLISLSEHATEENKARSTDSEESSVSDNHISRIQRHRCPLPTSSDNTHTVSKDTISRKNLNMNDTHLCIPEVRHLPFTRPPPNLEKTNKWENGLVCTLNNCLLRCKRRPLNSN